MNEGLRGLEQHEAEWHDFSFWVNTLITSEIYDLKKILFLIESLECLVICKIHTQTMCVGACIRARVHSHWNISDEIVCD